MLNISYDLFYGGISIKIGKFILDLNTKELKRLVITADALILVLALIFLFIFLRFKNKFIKSVSSFFTIIFSAALLIQSAVYVDMAFIEPNWIKVEYVKLKIPRLANALNKVRIVQFSDLHANEFGFRERQLVRIVNSLKPDIIIFTGGFTGQNFENIKPAESAAAKIFSLLKAKIGIWAITDDTDDMLLQTHLFRKMIAETGINLMHNQKSKIYVGPGKYFWLVGAEDAFYGRNGLSEAMYKIPVDEPKILISHSPNIIDNAADYGADLVLVGKTHGGQIGIKALRDIVGYIKEFKYMAGLYKIKNSYLYVNRGIGVKTSGYRLLCRPEVTVFDIRE